MAKNYAIEMTEDGSPTMRIDSGESMHHSGGAWAETLYVYGAALRWALSKTDSSSMRICNVGLGLGYNELLVAALCPQIERLFSFEVESRLVESFEDNLSSISDAYFQNILTQVNAVFPAIDPCLRLLEWRSGGRWRVFPEGLGPDFFAQAQKQMDWTICLYDAFSAQTNPELWEEEFLVQFLASQAGNQFAVFATYACRGSLKRALRRSSFQVLERPGFQGKRNATFAVRGPRQNCDLQELANELRLASQDWKTFSHIR